MVSIQQWSGCISKTSTKFDVNVKAIVSVMKTAMGSLSGVTDILSSLDDTVHLVCETTSSTNRFIKADRSQCGTMLVGVSMYATTKTTGIACINRYSTKFHCKMISAKVDSSDEDQIESIKGYFDEKFNKIIHPERSPSVLCGSVLTDSPHRLKNYDLELTD
jgi:prophage DNA circulation protein